MNFENAKIIDISPLLQENIAVFPGDTEYSRKEALSFEQGHNLRLSSINATLHLGAHTDAPSHYHRDGITMEKRRLDLYMGDCQVIEVKCPKGERVRPEHLQSEINSPRVLLKTNSFPNPNQWNNDFNALSKSLVESLVEKGVKLIGIDTPSVDLADDKELECHNLIYENDLAILEGIILSHVEPGHYQLIALPLNLQGADASPVRAILTK